MVLLFVKAFGRLGNASSLGLYERVMVGTKELPSLLSIFGGIQLSICRISLYLPFNGFGPSIYSKKGSLPFMVFLTIPPKIGSLGKILNSVML